MNTAPPKPAPQTKAHQPAMVVTGEREVPRLICPHCGCSIKPLVQRWRPKSADGISRADCKCPRAGCLFIFTPAQVRVKGAIVPATV